MIYDIFVFLSLYVFIVLAFTGAAQMIYVMKFDSYIDALSWMWNLSMGNYLLHDLDEWGDSIVFTRIFLFLCVMVNMVLLLNLVIALMANTYSRLTNWNSALYLNEIIRVFDKYKYSSKAGAITSNMIFINLTTLPFIPHYKCCPRKNSKIDSLLLHF